MCLNNFGGGLGFLFSASLVSTTLVQHDRHDSQLFWNFSPRFVRSQPTVNNEFQIFIQIKGIVHSLGITGETIGIRRVVVRLRKSITEKRTPFTEHIVRFKGSEKTAVKSHVF